MDDSRIKSAESDFEELAPLEELEEVDAEGFHGLPEGLSGFLYDLARSHDRGVMPLAILGPNLAFIHQNQLFRSLIKEYGYAASAPFPSIFSESFTEAEPSQVSEALLDPARGYSWKGVAEHRAKDKPAKLTKLFIQPLWPQTSGEVPAGYVILVDDITQENKRYLRDSLESLLKASLKKDRDTGNHVKRVNLYSRRLAEELFRDPRWPEVDVDYIDEIGFLAAMHDIGKIGTPDDILNKKGPLNEAEWKIMKEHTINGAFILSNYPNEMAKEIARSHHEWWNGSGYPYNLMGTMIPLSARIVTLADVYDALRMQRSYKPGYPHEDTLEKMAAEGGTHFDPDLVEVFLRIAGSFARIYEEYQDSTDKTD